MSEKYMKEIEEILKRAEELPEKPRPRPRSGPFTRFPSSLGHLFGGKGWRISPGKLMLAGVALFLAALVLRAVLPGTVGPLIWAGLALFILAYALFFIKPGTLPYEKRWRGRLIEDKTSLWERLKRWLKGT